jgi:predicted DNA-binding protein
MPTPEQLRPKPSQRLITFRLSDDEHGALLLLAERAQVGHSTLVRRIVEHYIVEHAPRRGAKRGRS